MYDREWNHEARVTPVDNSWQSPINPGGSMQTRGAKTTLIHTCSAVSTIQESMGERAPQIYIP